MPTLLLLAGMQILIPSLFSHSVLTESQVAEEEGNWWKGNVEVNVWEVYYRTTVLYEYHYSVGIGRERKGKRTGGGGGGGSPAPCVSLQSPLPPSLPSPTIQQVSQEWNTYCKKEEKKKKDENKPGRMEKKY